VVLLSITYGVPSAASTVCVSVVVAFSASEELLHAANMATVDNNKTVFFIVCFLIRIQR
jgi:hypothetical protein